MRPRRWSILPARRMVSSPHPRKSEDAPGPRDAVKTTAFVSHHDTPRHDTGWNHPDHQGRVPALTRAVYKDMLTLFDPLLQVEGVPAEEDDLLLAHTRRHVDAVRAAAERAAAEGGTVEVDGVPVSGASWEAARAAVGTALTGVETVLRGETRNAFCVARPPGRGASADAAGEFSLFNHVAIAARHLRERRGVGRVLVVDWGVRPPLATASLLAGDEGVTLLSLHQHPASFPRDTAAGETAEGAPGAGPRWAALAPGSGGAELGAAMARALASVGEGEGPDFVLLSAGFDVVAGDPLGGLAVEPRAVHDLTRALRAWADERAGGRLVSVLEGGYGPGLGAAVVQHLRALAGLDPA